MHISVILWDYGSWWKTNHIPIYNPFVHWAECQLLLEKVQELRSDQQQVSLGDLRGLTPRELQASLLVRSGNTCCSAFALSKGCWPSSLFPVSWSFLLVGFNISFKPFNSGSILGIVSLCSGCRWREFTREFHIVVNGRISFLWWLSTMSLYVGIYLYSHTLHMCIHIHCLCVLYMYVWMYAYHFIQGEPAWFLELFKHLLCIEGG